MAFNAYSLSRPGEKAREGNRNHDVIVHGSPACLVRFPPRPLIDPNLETQKFIDQFG